MFVAVLRYRKGADHIREKGFLMTGSGISGAFADFLGAVRWHVWHCLHMSLTSFVIFGQKNRSVIRCKVLLVPKWPAKGDMWAILKTFSRYIRGSTVCLACGASILAFPCLHRTP